MNTADNPSPARQPLLGGMLITLAVLSLFAMLHHPVAHSSGAQSHSEAMLRIAALARLVHGALITTMTLSLVLLGEFARLRVQHAAWMRAGFIAYLIGTLLLCAAAKTLSCATRIARCCVSRACRWTPPPAASSASISTRPSRGRRRNCC